MNLLVEMIAQCVQPLGNKCVWHNRWDGIYLFVHYFWWAKLFDFKHLILQRRSFPVLQRSQCLVCCVFGRLNFDYTLLMPKFANRQTKNICSVQTEKSTYRVAFGPTAFSARQKTACKFCLNPCFTMHANAPKMAAAPPQSLFIPGIDVFCLMLKPPVS